MPSKSTTRKARRDLAQGKSPSTAAGEFVREEIEHVRKGQHGARSSRQAVAIGLSQARRAGVPLKPPPGGRGRARRGRTTSTSTSAEGRSSRSRTTARRGRPAKRGVSATSATKGRKSKATRSSRATGTRRRRAASR